MSRTIVKFRKVHDRSPEDFIIPRSVSLAILNEELYAHFAKLSHTTQIEVRITATGPEAGKVTISHGPFAIEGWTIVERGAPPPSNPANGT